MCFVIDADWYASINEQTESETGPATKCCECYAKIAESEFRRHLWQQEHEHCSGHYDEYEDEPLDPERTCENDAENCSHGEEFEASTCRDCCTILAGIKAVELHEGCRESESQPPVGQMCEYITGGEGFKYYADKMTAIGLGNTAEIIRRKFPYSDNPEDDEPWLKRVQ